MDMYKYFLKSLSIDASIEVKMHTFESLDLYSPSGLVGSFGGSCPCTATIEETCLIAVKATASTRKGFVM